MQKYTEFPSGKNPIALAKRGKALCWAQAQRPKSPITEYYFSEDGGEYNRPQLFVKYKGDNSVYSYENEITLLFEGLLIFNEGENYE